MQKATLLVVTYKLRIPVDEFAARAGSFTKQIAHARGLIWKIWGLDSQTGEGTGLYLFKDRSSAEEFCLGPVLEALRRGPAEDVVTRISEVEAGLSVATGAGLALSAP